ncbi:polysaccharide deacetylase family protein [Radiobacillus deserti]|uniref:DUF2334 domain-containing protein n=1 Tax=Radiobacillus deserti TaxID=2594883 RepID=A0A516KI87_9BACI|nr:polysaccharide deacetylase family protein [Radiobacillus deserti]QDP41102.1 DUF2334 domain-containing protein [Radiobacillus deserti]
MKKIAFIILILFLISINGNLVTAEQTENHVLILYSPNSEQDVTQVQILDLIVGEFTSDITIKQVSDFQPSDQDTYTEIIYMGLESEPLPSSVQTYMEDFQGGVLFIGHNVEQLTDRFDFIVPSGEKLVDSVSYPTKNLKEMLPEERIIIQAKRKQETEQLLIATSKDGATYPLMVSQNNSYYLASESLFKPVGSLVREVLFTFFNQSDHGHKLYLRLEDIHPKTNPDNLMEIATYLAEDDIPYMAVVIPEYVNNETKQKIHLSDSPKLVKTLQYMQDHGGTIVLHGYKHQYRDSETGEGYEYWDVENGRPILQDPKAKALKREDFSSEEDYQRFLTEGLDYERSYIKQTLEQGIQELVAHKLYPLAFEAPHYAMSQTGYKILAEHFSTYIGQAQLSDKNWKAVYAPLSQSNPRFLRGMTLIPETLGYVEDENPEAIQDMKELALDYLNYSGSYLSAFYHPYLGVDKLQDLVNMLQELPDTAWGSLKNMNNHVEMGDIAISSHNGKIEVSKDFLSSEYEEKLFYKKVLVWGIPSIIGMILVTWIILSRRANRALHKKDL